MAVMRSVALFVVALTACGLGVAGSTAAEDGGVPPASSSSSSSSSSTSTSSSSSSSGGMPDAGGCIRMGSGQTSTYEQEVLSDGPSSWLRLDDAAGPDAVNAIPGGPTATYSAKGVTYGQPGATCAGKAVLLDGSRGRIRFGTARAFPDGQPYTIEVWARQGPGTNDDFKRRLLGFGPTDNKNPKFFLQTQTTSNVLVFVRAGSGSDLTLQGATVAQSAWTHVVVTVGASTTLYRDAVAIGTAPTPAYGALAAGSELVIGDLPDPQFTFKWQGLVDEVAIYDKVLPPARIRSHYDAGR